MTTNPFAEKLEKLESEYEEASGLLQDTKMKLAWFQGFNLDQESLNLQRTERREAEIQARLQQAQQRLTSLGSSAKELNGVASMGFDPRYWFSAERAIAKRQLAGVLQELTALQSKAVAMRAEISDAKKLGRKTQGDLEMARTFDPLLAQSIIVVQQEILGRIEPQMVGLRARRDALDDVLMEPLGSLRELEAKRGVLMRKISRAEAFNSELSNACNSYERAQIHMRCGNELGDSKPGNVLQQSRGELRSVDGKLAKLRARIDNLTRFATLDIRHIVVDANNLCYEGGRFLRLAALEAMVPILSRKYKVTLIFDANIRRMLKLSSKDIEARFPNAERVHIVASKRKADETVLAVAGDDPHTFVLSNDRFIDYPDTLAVKEERVLRHEIVGWAAYIHDLQIEAKFAIEPEAQAV